MVSNHIFPVLLVVAFSELVHSSEMTTTPHYANYGEPCVKILDCDSNAYLTCINGSCQCALNTMVFDDATSSCYVLPGEKCIYKAPDVEIGLGLATYENSDEKTLRDRLSFRCVSNAACEDGFCACETGFFPTMNKTCERQKEFGDYCQEENACRSSLHLICNSDGKCGCNETNSNFDEEHSICVGLSGSSCFDYELCTANAYCPSFGIFNQYDVKCTCKTGYYESANMTCTPKGGFEDDCDINQECREDMSLICDVEEKKCTCNMTSHLYDPTEGKCLSKVGSFCQESQDCVSNADCQHSGFLNGNVLARNRICKCAYGYYEQNNVCVKKGEFDSNCSDDSQCRDDLKLICNRVTGRCSCNETSYTYDRSRKRCIGFAGTQCERNEHCVINSVCRSPGYLYPRQYPKAECICREGFTKSVDGFCLGKYGSRCETFTKSCDSDLVCRSGECTCKYGRDKQYYDYTREKCVTHINAPCHNGTSLCISNAYCAKLENDTGDGNGVCRCNPGHALDGDNRCVALVGEKCSQGEDSYIPCVPHAKCVAGYCQCMLDYYETNKTCEKKKGFGEACASAESCQDAYCDMMGHCGCNLTTSIYNPLKNLCMRKANAKCYDLRECVPNALCRNPSRLNQVDPDARCICKDGYYVSNGTCEYKRTYFEACTESHQCQDASDLICSVHGRCECNQTISTYDDSRRTCLRLAGAPCSSHQHCISHAKCRNPLYWVHFDSFSPNARCECEKESGYTNSSDGRCIIDYYGGSCDNSVANSCSDKFICENGLCKCPYEEHQVYDHKTKSCVGLVKAPCDNNTNSCVKNANCITTEEGVPECRCKHGHIAVDRECFLSFGQVCSQNVKSESEAQCDKLAPLRCTQGTCQCGGFQFYDYELHKCRGLIGSRCDPEDKGFCTEGAFCETYRGLAVKRYGRCKCAAGHVAEANRTCTRIL